MIFMLVTFENVRFGYDEKNILEDVCFTVSEGDRIGLIGPNGEGKTTATNSARSASPPRTDTMPT